MDRNEIVWLLEVVLFCQDGVPKEQIISFGCPREIAEMGIKLFDYLKNKEIVVEI